MPSECVKNLSASDMTLNLGIISNNDIVYLTATATIPVSMFTSGFYQLSTCKVVP